MAITYTPIATTTLGATASSINFTSIPSTYTDLVVVWFTKTIAGTDLYVRFNSDTGTNYSQTALRGNGASASSGREVNQTWIGPNRASGTSTSSNPALTIINVFDYTGSSNKSVLVNCNNDQNGAGTVELTVGLWRNTGAITSINLTAITTNNFAAGTTATVYGILKA